jgi:8-oxo-dGTP pyrophosphatase MutT (NUDIX family)
VPYSSPTRRKRAQEEERRFVPAQPTPCCERRREGAHSRWSRGVITEWSRQTGCPTWNFSLVVVQHPDGRFLAVRESRGRGWWLPAGFVDPGDDLMSAAIRETKEEAGIDVRLEGVHGTAVHLRLCVCVCVCVCVVHSLIVPSSSLPLRHRHTPNRAHDDVVQGSMSDRLLCTTHRREPTTQVGARQRIRRRWYSRHSW